MSFKPYVVGVSGGSASGKTSFLESLQQKMPEHLTVLSQDHYYLDIEHQTKDENNEVNFDLPSGINKEQFS